MKNRVLKEGLFEILKFLEGLKMLSTEQRIQTSCNFAKSLAMKTGVERMVLSSEEKPGTFIVATKDEQKRLFAKTTVLWPTRSH